ncbi:hypothetical protein ACEWY4_009529 [Coilia grayii]|uniref:Disks large homologue 1 N-terminal PEST domain-containing protein n=1 Tax=Coilia grayii TaxID=363190 RepID=A0ABD1K6R6_9TELE
MVRPYISASAAQHVGQAPRHNQWLQEHYGGCVEHHDMHNQWLQEHYGGCVEHHDMNRPAAVQGSPHVAQPSTCVTPALMSAPWYRYQDEDSPPPEHGYPRLTNEVRAPELVHVSEKNLSEIENVHGYVSHAHISPLKTGGSPCCSPDASILLNFSDRLQTSHKPQQVTGIYQGDNLNAAVSSLIFVPRLLQRRADPRRGEEMR